LFHLLPMLSCFVLCCVTRGNAVVPLLCCVDELLVGLARRVVLCLYLVVLCCVFSSCAACVLSCVCVFVLISHARCCGVCCLGCVCVLFCAVLSGVVFLFLWCCVSYLFLSHTRYDTIRHVQDSNAKSTRITQDRTKQDKARQGKARQDKARQDKAKQDKTRQGKAKQDKTRQGKTRRHIQSFHTKHERVSCLL
jgi:hypothetical protein